MVEFKKSYVLKGPISTIDAKTGAVSTECNPYFYTFSKINCQQYKVTFSSGNRPKTDIYGVVADGVLTAINYDNDSKNYFWFEGKKLNHRFTQKDKVNEKIYLGTLNEV